MPLLEPVSEAFFRAFFDKIGLLFTRKRRVSEIMTDSVDVQELARDIITTSGLTVDFCYLMLAYNGRKVDKVHRFKFRKIIAGDHNWTVKNFRIRDYRRLPVDIQYNYILERLTLEGSVSMDITDMQDGMLKAIYLSQSLVYIRYYSVDYTNDGLWYLVVGTHSGGRRDFDSIGHVQKIFFRRIGFTGY